MKKSLTAAFENAARVMGWETGNVWTQDETGRLRAKVGVHFVQRAATEKPLYRIVRISNESGGESALFGFENFTSAELEALLWGIRYGATHTSKAAI
jgi:hypothetical protein